MTNGRDDNNPGHPPRTPGNLCGEVLELSRKGDVKAAIAVLREARSNGPLDEAATSLLFNLLHDLGVTDEVLALCDEGLALAKRPLAKSTWHLRRGLLHLEAKNRALALADFQMVLRLKASEDHTAQAQKALLAVAALPQPPASPKKRA